MVYTAGQQQTMDEPLNPMKRLVDFTFKHSPWIVLASILLTIITAYFVLQLKIDNSLETLTVDDDPALRTLLRMEEEFGSNEFVVVSFKGEDIWSPEILRMIDRMTRKIEDVENVEKVLSLTNAVTIQGKEGSIENAPLVSEAFLKANRAGELQESVLQSRIHNRMLFSDDGHATSIIAWLAPLGRDDAKRWQVVKAIREVVDEERGARKFHVYGMPVYQKTIMDIFIMDELTLNFLLFLLVGLLLYLFFRDLKLVTIPFILIGVTALWAVGLMILFGNTVNNVTGMIPTVVIIVCICDSVHILAQHRETAGSFSDHREALKDVVKRIGVPIILTSLTTAIGFFSLIASGIKSVRDFGVFTGLGVLFALTASITLLPIIMSRFIPKKGPSGENSIYRRMEDILTRTGEFVFRRKLIILVIGIAVIGISVLGMFRIESRQDIIAMIKDSDELDEAYRFIDYHLGGSCEFGILFEGAEENSVLEPENLRVMERIQHRLLDASQWEREVYPTRKVISLVDYLKEMHQAIYDGDSDYYTLPSTKDQAYQLLLLYSFNEDEADLDSLVNHDYSMTRMRIFTLSAENFYLARKGFDRMQEIMAEEAEGLNLEAAYTGRPYLFGNMVDSLVEGMVRSFSFAFLVILVVMILVFRSLRLGLISMVANVTPALITFGIMGWFDIPLNMFTAMVPSVAIGIAVDDTIHLMWRVKKEMGVDGDYKQAIIRSLRSVGKPIVTTTILLCVGFSVFYFSGLTVLTQFGLLTLLTVFNALITDLFLAPAMLFVFKPFGPTDPLSPNFEDPT